MADIMTVEKVLPQDFDGTFRFTNWTDEEFIGVWGKKEYHFPANSTSPILMTDQTPLEIQQIRKKFAKDLAEREFFKSEKYKFFLKRERNADGTPRGYGMSGAATYSLVDLMENIQKCLVPLKESKVLITDSPVEGIEDKLSRNTEGEINTIAIDKKTSLKKKALEA